jgi:putative ABC transport system substrate-binding protein
MIGIDRDRDRDKLMRMKVIGFMLCALLFALSVPIEAQTAGKVYRIGYLVPRSAPKPRDEAFRQGLHELGYIEGQNIIIEWRFVKRDRLAEVVAELVRLKVDVIVGPGTPPAKAAKAATKTIPIVFSVVSDPVGAGLVGSLARPGGNITGLTPISAELSAKRLELLKETVPRVSRIAVLSTLDYPLPIKTEAMNEMERVAQALGVQLQLVEVRGRNDFDNAFGAMIKEQAGAFTVLPIPMFRRQRRRIVELMARNRLPAIFHWSDYVKAGGLMSYGPNSSDLYRRAATYVDKILKGAKPAELPVEQPTRFYLTLNLKAAKVLGITFPPEMLFRADKVIK